MSDVFYLYQYTSLESLAMILENKTIRFSNLSLLDDPLEKYIDMIFRSDRGQKIEKNNIGKICFVSCWTKTKEESIAMWDMYGDRKKGVRIGLPSNMLNENYNIYGSEKSPIRFRIIAASNNGNPIPELIKVEYEKEKAIVDRTQDKRLTIDTLGKYKTSDWSFQNEYRYRLFALFDSKRRKNVFFNPTDSAFINFSSLNQPISDEFIFFGIDENVLSKIEIVRGPNISDGNRILLDALLDKYSIDKNRAFDSKFTDK